MDSIDSRNVDASSSIISFDAHWCVMPMSIKYFIRLVMQYLYLPLLALVILVSGCDHPDRVVDLIYGKYPNLKDGGEIEFVVYQESHKTKWDVRTFTATGVVRWDEKWFVVENEYMGQYGLDDVICVSECKEANEGVPFKATFYKGRTREKGSVSLDIKGGVDFFTTKTLLKTYSDKCIVRSDGTFIGKQFDSNRYQKVFNNSLNRGNRFVKEIDVICSTNASQVEKLASENFKRLNDDKLDEYLSNCTSVLGRFFIPEEIIFYRDDLQYFMSFPLKDFGQDKARELFQCCEKAENNLGGLKNKLNNILAEAKKEKEVRVRRGVKFLPAITKTENKTKQNKIKMPLHTENQKSGALEHKVRNEGSTSDSSSRQSVIVMPLKNNYALPSNGKKDVVVPVIKPMVITMPK